MISFDPIASESASTEWVKRALRVPCPACGGRLLVPDVATDLGRVAALHNLPVCQRFERVVSERKIGALAAFLREVADGEVPS